MTKPFVAQQAAGRTVAGVSDDLHTHLLPTPFVSSWIGRARPGADTLDPDPTRRTSAWAQWAVEAMGSMTGNGGRTYTALRLPGRYYDPRGTGPVMQPHLEIASYLFARPDPEFPDRLAQAGNALLFPWWVVPEVLAVKRAVLGASGASGELIDLLNARRGALKDALTPLTSAAASRWSEVEAQHVENPDALTSAATDPFTPDDVATYWPAAAELNLTVAFDAKLLESCASRTSRRVGVWTIRGTSPTPFTLGVLTPRLTRSSLFSDPLFAPDHEAPAALLVRGLILRRLLNTVLNQVTTTAVARTSALRPPQRLRAVVARVGDKLPEASSAAAVHFLNTYPEADGAWAALTGWADAIVPGSSSRRAILTVTQEGHAAAHRAALRAIRRAEEPERDDINVLLPLAWDHQSRVVRVTYSRPSAGDDDRGH